ncbi:cyclase family protein [uncultured Oscillibacter sp.]|uniref:cyclase family protein n=1 Tax=uncultured Oscillibacter sp. TaxID=876091 RepID=UPI0025E7608F|nr:cyclase family protein [uncultured Oscillibacter sp.]
MSKLIDLTMELHEGMPTYPSPWHPTVDIHQIGRIDMEHRRSYSVTLGSHTGTHMDSPAHMVKDGITIDQIPPETTVGAAKVLDFSHKGRGDKITLSDIQGVGVKLERGDRLIIKTGWYKEWGSNAYYDRWPWVTAEAAQYIVDAGVIFVAMDLPSPDDPLGDTGYGKASPIHDIFLTRGVILVEYLTNTLSITAPEVKIIALPLKVRGVDGFPSRVLVEQ